MVSLENLCPESIHQPPVLYGFICLDINICSESTNSLNWTVFSLAVFLLAEFEKMTVLQPSIMDGFIFNIHIHDSETFCQLCLLVSFYL